MCLAVTQMLLGHLRFENTNRFVATVGRFKH